MFSHIPTKGKKQVDTLFDNSPKSEVSIGKRDGLFDSSSDEDQNTLEKKDSLNSFSNLPTNSADTKASPLTRTKSGTRKGLFDHDEEYDTKEELKKREKEDRKSIAAKDEEIKRLLTENEKLQNEIRKYEQIDSQKDQEKLQYLSQMQILHEKVDRRNDFIKKLKEDINCLNKGRTNESQTNEQDIEKKLVTEAFWKSEVAKLKLQLQESHQREKKLQEKIKQNAISGNDLHGIMSDEEIDMVSKVFGENKKCNHHQAQEGNVIKNPPASSIDQEKYMNLPSPISLTTPTPSSSIFGKSSFFGPSKKKSWKPGEEDGDSNLKVTDRFNDSFIASPKPSFIVSSKRSGDIEDESSDSVVGSEASIDYDNDENDVLTSIERPLNINTTLNEDEINEDEIDNNRMLEEKEKQKIKHISKSRPDEKKARKSRHAVKKKSENRTHGRTKSPGRDSKEKESFNRMNEYLEARAENIKARQREEDEIEKADKEWKAAYAREWEALAEADKQRKAKLIQQRRKNRSQSVKMVRVSQLRHLHLQKSNLKEEKTNMSPQHAEQDINDPELKQTQWPTSPNDDIVFDSSDSDLSDVSSPIGPVKNPPLPPELTVAEAELLRRQQARVNEYHDVEERKQERAKEIESVREDVHNRLLLWTCGKDLIGMLSSLDQFSNLPNIRKCKEMLLPSPTPDDVRKVYRQLIRTIHPDKLQQVSAIQQLEGKELFTVITQAFEKYKEALGI